MGNTATNDSRLVPYCFCHWIQWSSSSLWSQVQDAAWIRCLPLVHWRGIQGSIALAWWLKGLPRAERNKACWADCPKFTQSKSVRREKWRKIYVKWGISGLGDLADGGDFEKDRKHMGKSKLRGKRKVHFLSSTCYPVGHPCTDVQKLVRNVHRRERRAGG